MNVHYVMDGESRKSRHLSRYHKPWVQDEEEGIDIYLQRSAKRILEVIE